MPRTKAEITETETTNEQIAQTKTRTPKAKNNIKPPTISLTKDTVSSIIMWSAGVLIFLICLFWNIVFAIMWFKNYDVF